MEAAIQTQRLLAAIDMGTNSFKLLLVRPHPDGVRFLVADRRKEPVLLGRDRAADGSLSPDAQLRALAALRSFSCTLRSHRIHHVRAVATSAVRDAPNHGELLSRIRDELGFEVDVLSGEEEARLVYRGVHQFLPLRDKSVLTVDIGGGSTEFVIGLNGEVLFAASLNLGHVSLTESFVKCNGLDDLRNHIRSIIYRSPVVEKVRELGFEVAVGSSGTARSIERAIFLRGAPDPLAREFSREWRFNREELQILVDNLCGLGWGKVEEVKRLGFSKRRAEFIVAGAVLMLEIFEALGISTMQVSAYSLAEGVVSEMLEEECSSYDVNANARWRSVVGLAERCDGEDRMTSAVQCVGIAKKIFDGVIRHFEVSGSGSRSPFCLDAKDFEFLEAAILLHNIGALFGKKGYHKCSYDAIKNSGQLHGFSSEEIELIALLARFHRKKFPKCKNAFLHNLSGEMKWKFRVLCVIIRVSHALQRCQPTTLHGLEVIYDDEGFKLVFTGLEDGLLVYNGLQQNSTNVDAEVQPELDHFEEVFKQKISVSLFQEA